MKKLFLLIGCVVALSSCGNKAADNAAASTENTVNTEAAVENAPAAEEAASATPAFDEKDAVAISALGLHKTEEGKWEIMFKGDDGVKRIILADDVTIAANGETIDAAAITAELLNKKELSYWLNEAGQIAHIAVK